MSNMTKEELMWELSEKHGITGFKTDRQKERDLEYYEKKDRQDKRHFSWQNSVNQVAIKYQLNDIQKGSLLLMSTFLKNNGQGELYDTKGNHLTVNKLADLIGRSKKQADRIVDECENIGAVTTQREGKERIITFTDMIYTCGNLEGDNKKYAKVFKLAVRKLGSMLSLKELGFLSDLLPHFHWESHILCENPTWNGTEGMKVWRRKDIIEKLGYNRNVVTSTFRKLKDNDVILELSGKIDVIYLSPNIVSRQSDKVTLEQIEKVARSVADNLTRKSYL
ncbi:hypothetical protein ACTFRO_14695 [Bacillus cereus group sp. MYBK163-2]|uniref:Uncharacterized protein n=2 Tax=Bacillus cereus group TaxID=86661 RepID=A0A9X0MDC8_BACCE|nr:hypothetical protein [Bacillus cereus]KXY31204.1 hypothetical protein AT268_17700 [Bacillus cereus]MDA2255145.1 hypothetical protein [Bacillus cereus]MDA2505214.1 hypothetical protein [Bacillus cereus]TFZ09191.1 hypothetical protein C6Y54_29730 [Bacillus cereus]